MEKVRRGENDQKKKRKGAAQHKSNTHICSAQEDDK